MTAGRPRLRRRDKALAWVVTGPAGRVAAFAADLAAAWWGWGRRRVRARTGGHDL